MATLPAPNPHLLPGQRLSREEFLRRWEALPELKNAELIDGIVYMASPVSNRHSEQDFLLHGWLSRYEWSTPGVEGGCNETWMMLESAPQPDAHLRIRAECGGRSMVSGRYSQGAPELVVEISGSSATDDVTHKLSLYQRAGVLEYITVAIETGELIWRILGDGGRYHPLPPDADGILRSRTFPGLWLDPQAVVEGSRDRMKQVLDQGLASREHSEFAAGLAARLAGNSGR